MPNFSLNVDTDSSKYQSGTVSATCPKCDATTEMERWTSTRQFRVVGMPVGKRTKETLKCTACGKESKADDIA